ncbi:Zinc ABC transporter, periplasmic-binding protein ZnuA [hydrothermal vent metagenome]|uniref:Zinc ABC transporter, periplasmic-binding protein ZnuA n=1 Tax=hydrothermal vent metagenome TaxID=652676 RepID=A0A1W1CAK0_9ZZZZ
MKKLLFICLFSILTFAKTNVIVSILPQKIFVDKIGGDKVNTTVMVETGASPHNYSPKPSQMKAVSKADIYFSIGVEFEKIWLEKFKYQNKDLKVIDVSKNIQKYHDSHKELDPHIWVDPLNVKIIAQNIYNALIDEDKNSSSYYKKNLELFLKELDTLDSDIKTILEKTPKNSSFMVFHPSWGYFAKRYNLRQLPVEIEGKEPKMKALIKLMKQAKKENVHAIFTQPEFSDKSAQIIAKNLNIKVIKASPLAPNWSENLKNLAKTIADKEN